MDEDEEHQHYRNEEVYCPRGLPPAQSDDRGWQRRFDSRGHGKTRPDYQGEESEYDEQISEALQQVIRPVFFLTPPPEVQMPGNIGRQPLRREIGGARNRFLLKWPLKSPAVT